MTGRTTLARLLALLPLLALSACGDPPEPFIGYPGRTAMRLATPPPARLVVPTPTGALLPPPAALSLSRLLATALVDQELPAFSLPAHTGDWQLAITAHVSGGQIAPRLTLLDATGGNRGDIDLPPQDATAWQAGTPKALAATATLAAPRVVALLRGVDAAIKQSDPNSLYNRPARVFVAAVTGAPGDGNFALTRLMRAKLPETGETLVPEAANADFIIRGTVHAANLPTGEEQVEIHWHVVAANGHEAGDVAQGHDLPHGTLDHLWGEVADAVTAEAAGGVHEVMANFIGKTKPNS